MHCSTERNLLCQSKINSGKIVAIIPYAVGCLSRLFCVLRCFCSGVIWILFLFFLFFVFFSGKRFSIATWLACCLIRTTEVLINVEIFDVTLEHPHLKPRTLQLLRGEGKKHKDLLQLKRNFSTRPLEVARIEIQLVLFAINA